MALYVLLVKTEEQKEYVTYEYGPNEKQLGLIRINKLTGDVKDLVPAAVDNHARVFMAAAVKLRQYVSSGEFPERTSWSS